MSRRERVRGGEDRSNWATAGELADRTLLWATRSGREHRAETALQWGANPDKLDDKGLTAIERAARYGKADVCRRLMAHGADIFSRDERGQTVLLRAASWGNVDVVKALIEEGKADHRDRDMMGNTPLLRAAYSGSLEVFEYLVSIGADIDAVDNRGRGVIELAKYWHPKEDRRAHANCPKIVEFVEKFIAERDAVKEESDAESFD